jgi:hypothetical protein
MPIKLNSRGFSLIQVVVATGILGILAVMMTSLFTQQQREMTAVSEKLTTLDLKRELMSTLSTSALCTYQLTTPPLTFDSTALSSTSLDLSEILSRPIAGAPFVVKVGQRVSPNVSSVVVTAIRVQNFVAISADDYVAEIAVEFDTPKLIRPLKPITSRISLTTSGPPNAKQITSCSGIGGSGSGSTTITLSCASSGGPCPPPSCPSGWNDLGVDHHVTAICGATGGTVLESYDRKCSIDASLGIVENKCTYFSPGASSCTPPPCTTGWTSLASSTYASACQQNAGVAYVFSNFCKK